MKNSTFLLAIGIILFGIARTFFAREVVEIYFEIKKKLLEHEQTYSLVFVGIGLLVCFIVMGVNFKIGYPEFQNNEKSN